MISAQRMADVVRLGLHGVVVHKVRSVLTILGILFGVWSVIAMLAINAGLSVESQRQLRNLGSTNIIIDSVKPAVSGGGSSSASGTSRILSYGLTRADADRLRDNPPGVVESAVMHWTRRNADAGAKRQSISVFAVEAHYADVAGATVESGRFINDIDVIRHRPCCLITRELAAEMFPCQDPLDKTLYLSDRAATHAFTVIGVLNQLPQALARQAGSGQRCAIIPLTTDLATFGEVMVYASQGSRDAERVAVSQCILRMRDEQAVLAAAPIVRELLERYHPGVRDYEVRVPVEEIELMKADRRRWNFMFVMIASVSLLVGGIGIMNIMLASVTERTREIGIRRALGAKRRHIVTQFLVESVTLTTIGGALGIAIGLLVPWIIRQALGFQTLTTTATLLVPFVMAVVVGLLSGLYPALRAARLDPVEALRHE